MSDLVGTIALSPVDQNTFKKLMAGKTEFIQAGYSQDKAHILSVDTGCPMKNYNMRLNVVIHACDAVHGDSGSPIFYRKNGQTKIAYIHVATTRKGRSEGIAVSGVTIANYLKKIGYWKKVRSAAPTKKAS